MILTEDQTRAVIPFTISGGNRTRYEIIAAPDASGLVGLTSAGSSPLNLDLLAGEGVYTIRLVRDSSGQVLTDCNVASDQINVVVSLTPTDGNAGSNSVLNCNQTSTTLAGNAVTVGTATWSQVSGPNTAIISDVNIPNPEVSGMIPGEYVFRYLVSAGPSSQDSFSDTFVTYAVPPVANAGADDDICAGTAVLHGNALEAGQTGLWTVSPNTGLTFSDNTSPNSIVSGLGSSEVYTFTWTISTLKCGDDSDDVILTTNLINAPSSADAGQDQCLTSGTTSGTLTAIETETPFKGTGTWTFVSGPTTPVITSSGTYTATVTGMTQDGDYEFKWTVKTLLCTATTEDTVLLSVAPNSGLNIDAGPDQTVCGDQVVMAANTPATGLVGTWEQVSGNAGWAVDDVNSPTAIFTTLVDGNYTFKWVVSKGSCESSDDEMKFSISTGATTATAGPLTDICNGTTLTLTGNTITEGIGTWSVVSGPNNPTIADIHDPVSQVSGLASGAYVFKWTSSNGVFCPNSEATTSVNIATEINLNGKDQDLCAASQVLLEANTGAMGVWTQTAPINSAVISITTTSENTAIVELDPTITDSYIFTFTATATLLIECTVNSGTTGRAISNITTAAIGDQADPTTTGDILEAIVYINNETDIVLNKTVNNNSPNEGDNVLYSITVTNNGPISATNLVVNDLLPAGLNYVAGTVTAGTWSYPDWSINELVSGATATLIMQVNVANGTAGQTLVNVASNSQDQLDNNITPDNPEATVIVSSADLVTVKTVDNSTPNEGDTIGYTITVTNNGTSDASGISLEDNLPNGVTYVSDDSSGYYSPGSGIWRVGDLMNGTSTSITIQATVDVGTAGTTVVNKTTAAVGMEADPSTKGDILEAAIYIDNETDIAITKNVNNASPNEGEYVIYTITVSNNGTIDATNLVVEDMLPAGLSYVSALPTRGLWVAPYWNVGTVIAGQTETLLLRVLVDTGSSGNSYTNTISNTQDQLDNNLTPDDDTATIVVSAADLRVEKTVDNASPIELSTINYTISVTNDGPNDATGVTITDVLPAEVTYVSDDGAGAYNSGSGLWTIGTILNGDTKTLTISTKVRLLTNGNVIINTTSDLVADQYDLDATNNVGSVTVTPIRDVDLSLTKRFIDGTDIAQIGNQKTFEIEITNSGMSIATGVEVTDILPSGYKFVKYSSTTGVYDPTTGLWNVGIVVPNKPLVLTIDVLVLGTGLYENCAEITAMNEADLDSTPGNGDVTEDDYACIGISYISSLDLGVVETELDTNLTPKVGEEVRFKIELTNYGQLDALFVTLSDVLPSGYTYIANTSSKGIYDVNTGIWSISNVEKRATEVLIIVATVNGTGDYENCVTIIGSDSVDSDSTNNTSCLNLAPIGISDLELTKSVTDNNPTSGDEIEFTIKLLNKGPSVATGVQVLDILPTGYTFISSNATEGTYDEATGIWDVGSIQLGEEELTIQVKVLSTGVWDNTAEVWTSNEEDPDSTTGNSDPSEDDQDTVEVDVNVDFFIPEEFTPNGDGINDTFEIVNLSVLYPDFKIVIVNRWGNKVFAYKHSGNPNTEPTWWNGYSDGGVNLGSGDVPDGTYFYTIEFNNNDRAPQTGWVYLRR